jgi:hypothetical protein
MVSGILAFRIISKRTKQSSRFCSGVIVFRNSSTLALVGFILLSASLDVVFFMLNVLVFLHLKRSKYQNFSDEMTKEEFELRANSNDVRDLTGFLNQSLPGSIEIPDPSSGIIAIGFGTAYKEIICAILLSKQGMKLGFNRGSELSDPHKLLRGSGKVHRYLPINKKEDYQNPEVMALLAIALEAWKKRK